MTSSMSNRLNQPKIAHDLIPPRCIHEIKTKGYDVIGVNVPPARSCKLMRFPLKKRKCRSLYHYYVGLYNNNK